VSRAEYERKFRSILNEVVIKVNHNVSGGMNIDTESSVVEM
jgi:hypothetical protein